MTSTLEERRVLLRRLGWFSIPPGGGYAMRYVGRGGEVVARLNDAGELLVTVQRRRHPAGARLLIGAELELEGAEVVLGAAMREVDERCS